MGGGMAVSILQSFFLKKTNKASRLGAPCFCVKFLIKSLSFLEISKDFIS